MPSPPAQDETLAIPMPSSSLLLVDLHLGFLKSLEDGEKLRLDATMMAHLRMNAVYWALTALCLLGHGPWTATFDQHSPLTRQEIVEFVMACWRPEVGGFGGNVGLDAHLLFTLSAIQILVTMGEVSRLNVDAIVSCTYTIRMIMYFLDIEQLQQPDGSFAGDEFGEIDTRFSYCAIAALSLLQRLDAIDCEAAARHIDSCRNFDGGYGVAPGCESHAGQSTASSDDILLFASILLRVCTANSRPNGVNQYRSPR